MLENENRNCSCGCNCNCNNNYMMNNNANMMVENTDYPNAMPTTAGIGGNQNNNNNNNCCRTSSCNTTPRIPVYSYEFTNIGAEETCEKEQETREEMLQKIRCLKFAIVELAEYLDTHEDDEKALRLHREYATRLNELMEQYQKAFGPLTIACPCNKWRWLEEPWPSFILGVTTYLQFFSLSNKKN